VSYGLWNSTGWNKCQNTREKSLFCSRDPQLGDEYVVAKVEIGVSLNVQSGLKKQFISREATPFLPLTASLRAVPATPMAIFIVERLSHKLTEISGQDG
jgi:hypothetical protein